MAVGGDRLQRRVVVTGRGLVTPLGTGVRKTWEALCGGKSGIDRISRFDPSDLPVQIAGEVRDFDPASFIDKKEIKKMDTFIHFALAASQMAVDEAVLKITPDIADRVGVYIGAGIGGLPAIEAYHKKLLEEGHRKISPFFIPMVIINLTSGQVAIRFGARGPNSSVSTACATGSHAIGDAFKIIQRGDADVMVAGGTESTITPLCIAGFAASKALSTRNNEPQRASRPFNADRDGFVLAEGAGVLVLEEMEFAKARGARMIAEVAGYGMTGDAFHITSPPNEGHGAARCMALALKDAGLRPEEVDYINAHATSTMADVIETRAIKSVFGNHARKIPVGATKSMTGHMLGGAGGVEAVICVLSIDHGILPPTINCDNPDPECDLDCIAEGARRVKIRVALSNSFGFGGTNACLLFRRIED